MDLLERLRKSFLNFNSAMIYIIHKILALLKNHPCIILKIIFQCFLKSIIDF